MKKCLEILAILFCIGIIACNSAGSKKKGGQAQIKFSETEFDFGVIKQGEKVSHRFIFKNIGQGDLIIKNVDPSCGCTVASFPNIPVGPGEESYVEATFDSDGYQGLNIKQVEVRTNCSPSIINLTLSAKVEESQLN
jgi:hypothetical protein